MSTPFTNLTAFMKFNISDTGDVSSRPGRGLKAVQDHFGGLGLGLE